MLQIVSFTFNPFQENTFLWINENKECWITDPGMYGHTEEKILFDYIENNQLKPQQIINTHAHIDHILGIDALKTKYNIPFGMHQKEMPVLSNAKGSAMMFGLNMGASPNVDFYINEGDKIHLGTDEIEVRFTPGHSPGSIVFYYPAGKLVVAGDVLFNGSIGRTDLPGGDYETLMESITNQMYTLPDETTVYCGHGPSTTISNEKLHNPYIRG